MATKFDASGDILKRTANLPAPSAWTLCAWVRVVSVRASQYQYFIELGNAASDASAYLVIGYRNNGAFELATGATTQSFASAPTTGSWFFCAVTSDGTNFKGYFAHPGSAWVTATTSTQSFTSAQLSIGNDSWNEYCDVEMENVLVYDAALTQAELEQQMYRALPVRTANLNIWSRLQIATDVTDYSGNGRNWTSGGTLASASGPALAWGAPVLALPFVAAAAGPTYTLTAAQGAVTLTGQAMTPKAARLLTAAQGSHALTGQAMTPTAARLIAAGAGAFSLNGQAATPVAARLLSGAQGTYTATGQAMAPAAGRVLAAAHGAHTATGQAAGLSLARLLAAARGDYALSGQSAGLTYTPAGGPTYTLAGDHGAVTATGQAAALLAARLLTAGQGSHTLTGQDAALLAGRLLTAAQGSHTLTGQAAGFALARVLAAARGDYALSGQATAMTYSGEGVTTAAARIAAIAQEDRTAAIDADDRVAIVSAESRTLTVI